MLNNWLSLFLHFPFKDDGDWQDKILKNDVSNVDKLCQHKLW